MKDWNYRPAGVVAKHIPIGSGGLGFDSWAGGVGRCVVNGSPPLPRFFRALLPRR